MNTGNSFLDRLIDRLDRLDPSSVQNYLLKLVREKGFLETVFNTIHEGIIVIDRGVRIHYINQAACGLLGIPADSTGQRLDRYIRDADWLGLMAADPEEWRRVSFQEIDVFYPQHRTLTFYVMPHPAENESKTIQFATIIFHDVTQSRKSTEQAIETQKVEAITKLAAGVAHEIGNPLNSLNIHLQLLQRTLQGTDDHDLAQEAGELVSIAAQEVQRLDSIVHNFLRAIRPTPPKMESIAIQEVLGQSLRFMRHEIENRNIRVEASLPDKLPRLSADQDQLKQAFYNIIKNSLQAMDDGGVLSIDCAIAGDFLELKFKDTGKGISAADLAHILEPYYTTRPDGTGLGLLVVEQILRNHGAEFGIESAADEGTVFTVRFPLRERSVRLLEAAHSTASTAHETNGPTRQE